MPDFRRSPPAAAIDLASDDEAAADARADGNVEDWREPLARTEDRFGQAGDIGVVAQYRGPAQHFSNPVGQRETVPAFDLVRFDDRARPIVDRTAETDADAAHLI